VKKQPSSRGEEISVYRRIENDLRDNIQTGRWAAGMLLPSQRDLALKYRVSPGTVRRAVEPLLTDGTLLAEDRRGTFVAQRHPANGNGHNGSLSAVSAKVADPPPESAHYRRLETVGIVGAIYTDWSGLNSQDTVILRAMEQSFSEQGIVTTLYNRFIREDVLTPLTEAVEAALREKDDALVIICMLADRVQVEEALRPLNLNDVPAVCILSGELHLPIPHIFYDNRMAAFQAAKHLISKGHRKISVVAPTRASWVTERLEGIRNAMAHARLPADSLTIISGDARQWQANEYPMELGYAAVKAALAEGWIISGGIIGISDDVAKGLIIAAAEIGLKPGIDFAPIGFDDHPYDVTVGLTTMRPPLEDMGKEAARLLSEGHQGVRTSFQIRLRAHLIPRSSTRHTTAGDARNTP